MGFDSIEILVWQRLKYAVVESHRWYTLELTTPKDADEKMSVKVSALPNTLNPKNTLIFSGIL